MNVRNKKEDLLFLSEILERDDVTFSNNNFIKSPVGSGKTTTILKTLAPQYSGKKLMLASTSMLEDELGMEEGVHKLKDVQNGSSSNEDVILLTYSSFGNKILFDDDFIEDVEVIFCDEIHSLFDYYMKHRSANYVVAIKALFKKYDDKDIYYFTATDEKIDQFVNREYDDTIYRNVNFINYYDNEDIMRYFVLYNKKFHGSDGIKAVIDNLYQFKDAGKKGVIFNERVSGMKNIQEHLTKKGYKSIAIWSKNNTDHPMSDEQLYVRSVLLRDKVIPEGYDFIIINESMREGWSLKDPNVELVILNTLDETNKEQALGRVRKDITFLLTREKDGIVPLSTRIIEREKVVKVIERNLDKELTKKDKDVIAEELDVRREENNTLVKWNTIKEAITSKGKYEVKEKKIVIDSKQVRVSVITKIEPKVTLSNKVKAGKFLWAIDKMGFFEVNKDFLDNYIKKDKSIAVSHILSQYERNVSSDNWTERKYADITYLLARDKKLFSKDNYKMYGLSYEFQDSIDMMTERAKYESNATGKLEILLARKAAKEIEMKEELLKYIEEHSE